MPADRCIGAAGGAGHSLDQPPVQHLAHAVQALELVARTASGTVVLPGNLLSAGKIDDRRDGERVVGRELREDARAKRKQPLGAGHVVQVGHGLAGEDRVVVEPALLGALHLGVPIGALDEAQHEAAVEALGEGGDPVDRCEAALLIGLDREAEPVPSRQ